MKKKQLPEHKGRLKKTKVPDLPLFFSFKYFDTSDPELCPSVFHNKYTQSLMQRLKSLSSWTAKEFITKQDKSIRNHTHNWLKTTRPKGFIHLHEQLQSYEGWQFQISSNKHGRVHGIIIDNIFYII
ncbi:MAG: hypothetical protein K940chlam5_01289 [Candidatus Anoxychlamydiales bacterium]|nr:hypothetical protein [Candidatus Anoxychlamydiales bacterium]